MQARTREGWQFVGTARAWAVLRAWGRQAWVAKARAGGGASTTGLDRLTATDRVSPFAVLRREDERAGTAEARVVLYLERGTSVPRVLDALKLLQPFERIAFEVVAPTDGVRARFERPLRAPMKAMRLPYTVHAEPPFVAHGTWARAAADDRARLVHATQAWERWHRPVHLIAPRRG